MFMNSDSTPRVRLGWIRILYRCWQQRTPYDEAKYLQALRRRGSPLFAAMAASSTEP